MVLRRIAGDLFSKPSYIERLQETVLALGGNNGLAPWRRRSDPDTAGAKALDWTSLGIGVAEVAAPQQVASLLGIEDSAENQGILRVLGARELMHGAAILVDGDARKLRAGVWARVAGDTLDCALLGVAATRTKRPASFALVTAMVTAVGVADLICALRLSRRQ